MRQVQEPTWTETLTLCCFIGVLIVGIFGGVAFVITTLAGG